MSLVLIIEETQLKGPTVTFKEEGKRLSQFSSQLPSSARELYRRATNYGNVTQSLVNYLTTYHPTHPIIINMSHYQGTVYWNEESTVEIKLSIILTLQGVTIQFRQENTGEVIWLTDELVIYPDVNTLVYETHTMLRYKSLHQKLITQWPIGTTEGITRELPLILSEKEREPLELWIDQDKISSDQTPFSSGLQIEYQDDNDRVTIVPVLRTSDGIELSLSSVIKDIVALCPKPLRNTPLFFKGIQTVLSDQDMVSILSPQDQGQLEIVAQWQNNITNGINQNQYIIVAQNKNWITGIIPWHRLIKNIYFIWTKMEGLQTTHFETLSLPKSHFHALLPQLETWATTHDSQISFKTQTIQTEDWDIELTGDLDPNTSIWDRINITGNQNADLSMINQVRMTDWVITQSGKTIILTPETQEKINALFITEALIKPSSKKNDTIPYRVSTMIHYLTLYQSGIKVAIPESYQTRIQQLLDQTPFKKPPLPNHLKLTPREYQVSGYHWLIERHGLELGAVLADEMGLGKTMQAIMLILAITQKIIPSHTKTPQILIVVPPSLLYNWFNEITAISTELEPLLYFGPTRDKDRLAQSMVTITSYDLVRRDLALFKLIQYEVVIFDEAQWVKNIKARRAIAARYLNRKFTLCLTGTPLENHVGDYYAIMDLAIPGILGNLSTFQTLYQDHGDQWLKKRTAAFILRRLKGDILEELPKKTTQTITLHLSPAQTELYQGIVQKVQQYYSKTGSKQTNTVQILTAILRLRQLCITQQLLNPEDTDLSPKFNYLSQTIPDILENNHSCLLYSQFTKVLDQLEPLFKEINIPFLRIDGKVATKKRQHIVTEFQKADVPMVLMMTLKTGGVGLNLTRASYVIHLDPWWNPATEDQATDRAHRIGQTEPVTVYKLVMKDSIEERIFKLKQEKQNLLLNILDTTGQLSSFKNLDLATLVDLL